MSNIASISEMLKFHFGSKIICSDGEDGFLAQVVFDSSDPQDDSYRCETAAFIWEYIFSAI